MILKVLKRIPLRCKPLRHFSLFVFILFHVIVSWFFFNFQVCLCDPSKNKHCLLYIVNTSFQSFLYKVNLGKVDSIVDTLLVLKVFKLQMFYIYHFRNSNCLLYFQEGQVIECSQVSDVREGFQPKVSTFFSMPFGGDITYVIITKVMFKYAKCRHSYTASLVCNYNYLKC